MGKTVILGLDGIPYRLMDDLSELGVMSNFKELKEQGVFTKLRSSIPEISSVAWSSAITGKNAGEHGIFGFTDMVEGTYAQSFPNYKNLRAEPFWKHDDKKYVIMNVPSTYPAAELNGFLVSGFVSLDLEKATYPKEYIPKLEELDYKIDVDSAQWNKSQDLFVKDLFDVLEKRIIAYRHFWNAVEWDVFMLVFTGTDRLGHFLWDAYEDENHKYHAKVLDFFKRIDEVIGEIAGKLGEEDSLIMHSDHGFEGLDYNINVNVILRGEGFLKLEDGKERKYSSIAEETKAFAMEPGRIYLNRNEKYPRGSVEKGQEKEILDELVNLFENLEMGGKRVIKKVFRKKEIYHGPCLDKAPDLVLLAFPGFQLRGGLNKDIVFEKDEVFTGKHTYDDAFLFVKASNAQEAVPDDPSVEDILSILNKIR